MACETAPTSVAEQDVGPASPVVPPDTTLARQAGKDGDEVLSLEQVNGEHALNWVKEQNKKAEAVLAKDPRYDAFRKKALALLTAQDRSPTPIVRGDGDDSFWQDQKNVRGLCRRKTLATYRADKPQRQTVRHGDALAKDVNHARAQKTARC